MSYLTVSDKSVMNVIERMFSNSVSKADIFNNLKYSYIRFTPESLAVKISSFITPEIKKKNRIPVYILAVVLIIRLCFSIVNFISFPQIRFIAIHWIVSIIIWSITIMFLIGFLRYKLSYYTAAVSIYTFIVLFAAIKMFNQNGIMILLNLLCEVLTLIFLVLLRKRLFPNINLFGHVRKDGNKNFVFK
jgi:hypothetical protein